MPGSTSDESMALVVVGDDRPEYREEGGRTAAVGGRLDCSTYPTSGLRLHIILYALNASPRPVAYKELLVKVMS